MLNHISFTFQSIYINIKYYPNLQNSREHAETQRSLGPRAVTSLYICSLLSDCVNCSIRMGSDRPRTLSSHSTRSQRGNLTTIWWSNNKREKVDVHAHIPGNIPVRFRMKTPMVIVVISFNASLLSCAALFLNYCGSLCRCPLNMLNERR